jgi:hypothetical protein
MKYHYITFATEDHMYLANDIIKNALKIGKFDTVQIYTLSDLDFVFLNKNKQILDQPKGAGYWIWKPYVIQKN